MWINNTGGPLYLNNAVNSNGDVVIGKTASNVTSLGNFNFNRLIGYSTNYSPMSIEWPGSNYGPWGFAHKIENYDYGNGLVVLNVMGKDNTQNFSNLLSITTRGRLGIGIVDPKTCLSIRKDETQSSLGRNEYAAMRISNTQANNFGNRSELQFGMSEDKDQSLAVIAAEYTTYQGTVGGALLFGTSPGIIPARMYERMRITSSGNVLIAKSTQVNTNYKLDVDGVVRANEIVVNTTGADFVFDSGYKLRPLKEVEEFVRTNQHLPEIESAEEMQANGVSLGNLNTKLLQKVEELTLYLIEQQKEIEGLKMKLNKN
jgi:hypothetical protein